MAALQGEMNKIAADQPDSTSKEETNGTFGLCSVGFALVVNVRKDVHFLVLYFRGFVFVSCGACVSDLQSCFSKKFNLNVFMKLQNLFSKTRNYVACYVDVTAY